MPDYQPKKQIFCLNIFIIRFFGGAVKVFQKIESSRIVYVFVRKNEI